MDTCVQATNGEFEAQQVKAFLEANGIPARLRGEALRKTHGLTVDGLGRVEVHVRPEQVDEARDLLARVEAGELSLGDGGETDSA